MILNFIKFADMTKRDEDIFSQDVKGVLSPRGLRSALRATSFWMHATWMPRPSNACSLQLPHGAMEGRLQQSRLGSQNSTEERLNRYASAKDIFIAAGLLSHDRVAPSLYPSRRGHHLAQIKHGSRYGGRRCWLAAATGEDLCFITFAILKLCCAQQIVRELFLLQNRHLQISQSAKPSKSESKKEKRTRADGKS